MFQNLVHSPRGGNFTEGRKPTKFTDQVQLTPINARLAQLFAHAGNLHQAGQLDHAERELDRVCQDDTLNDSVADIAVACNVPALMCMAVLDSAVRMATVGYNNLGNDNFVIAGRRKEVVFRRASARCHDKALTLAQRAMDAEHLQVIALFGLGRAAAFQGQTAQAQQYLQASVQIPTVHPHAVESQQKARQLLANRR